MKWCCGMALQWWTTEGHKAMSETSLRSMQLNTPTTQLEQDNLTQSGIAALTPARRTRWLHTQIFHCWPRPAAAHYISTFGP